MGEGEESPGGVFLAYHNTPTHIFYTHTHTVTLAGGKAVSGRGIIRDRERGLRETEIQGAFTVIRGSREGENKAVQEVCLPYASTHPHILTPICIQP